MPSILMAVVLLPVLLLLLFGLLLAVPVRLSMNLRKDGAAVQGGYILTWMGLAVKRAEVGGKAKAGQQEEAERQSIAAEKDDAIDEKKHPEKDGQKEGRRSGSAAPSIGSVISAAPALADILFGLLRKIRLRNFSGQICFGLDDPADTATAYGCLWSLAAASPISPAVSAGLSIQPYFEGERLEGELAADLEGRPIYALAAALQALWIRETRMLIKESMGWA